MFGIGLQELVLIGLLFLVIFGPEKAASMARDLGRFVNEARGSVDDFKSELMSDEEIKEAHRTVDAFKSEFKASEEVKEVRRSVEEFKSGLAPDKSREDDRHRKP